MSADASRQSVSRTIEMAPSMTDRLGAEVSADAGLCVAALGEPLTAFVAGAESVAQYREWLDGTDQLRPIASRLAATRRVIHVFEVENDFGLALAWLRDVGAAGEVPARMIRHKGDDESIGQQLADLATKWLAGRRSTAVAAVA